MTTTDPKGTHAMTTTLEPGDKATDSNNEIWTVDEVRPAAIIATHDESGYRTYLIHTDLKPVTA